MITFNMLRNLLHKYATIVGIYWQRGLTYRFTIAAYRVGEVMESLILIFMWTRLYDGQTTIRGFTLPEMITYVLIGNLTNGIVRNFLSDRIARDIRDGSLSAFLVRPLSYFENIAVSSLGSIAVTSSFSTISQLLVLSFFHQYLVAPVNMTAVVIVIAMLFFAFVNEILINYLIGLIAFWTDEIDGVYATINQLKKFFSGGYFPLSLLPTTLAQISYALPFAYTFAIPAQMYLGKLPLSFGLHGLIVQACWIVALAFIIRIVWRRGMKRYEATGI